MPFEEPLVFKAEWFDHSSGLYRRFNLSFYESDNSVEMFDLTTRKLFLKRCHADKLSKSDFFVGNTIVVYSRHLYIKECANDYTREQVDDQKQSVLILVYPESHYNIGHILDCMERGGFSVIRARTLKFTTITAQEFWQRFEKEEDIETHVSRMASK